MKQGVILTKIGKLEKEQEIQRREIDYLHLQGLGTAIKLQAIINLTKRYWWIPMSSLYILSNKVLSKEMVRLDKERVDLVENKRRRRNDRKQSSTRNSPTLIEAVRKKSNSGVGTIKGYN